MRRFPHRAITSFSCHSLVVPGKCRNEAIGSSVAADAMTRSRLAASQLSDAVSSPLAGPLADGCRHRASKDGFTACPASGEGTAHSSS
ncbi:hypothetical protein XAP412_190077 [Xanthomonas phaseoli pv. phaseoli]|uniref:Uncharacterized protein n=1 Tax=Xanthomonas campestris pv. phaseoli TaxID=317013 RepID=A0AB38DY47_XANCH|nr:hypothetical protein XAP412_190077 [Xanthomonas phaseoli pv. phaseoli]SON85580.1 hypothetical protein XAP7430_210007 [Xanthomonas phaseoli pv. phaseoli]